MEPTAIPPDAALSLAWIGFGAAIVAPTAAAIVTGIVSSRNLSKQLTEGRTYQLQDRRLELYSDVLGYLWERRQEREALHDAADDYDELTDLSSNATRLPPAALRGRVDALAAGAVKSYLDHALDSHENYLKTVHRLCIALARLNLADVAEGEISDEEYAHIDQIYDDESNSLLVADYNDGVVAVVVQEMIADPGLETRFDRAPSIWRRLALRMPRMRGRRRRSPQVRSRPVSKQK